MALAERNSRFNEAGLRDLLARQHGLASKMQLDHLGFSASAISRRVKVGELERVFPRVYRSPLVAPTVAQSALAATLWAGAGSAAAFSTAATMWGIGVPLIEHRVELWVPAQRAPKHPGVLVHRGTVAGNDLRRVGGVPVTSAARTIIDLAGSLDAESVEAALEDVVHRGLTTPGAIERRLGALAGTGRRGSAHLRALLRDRDQGPLESRLEVKVWRLLRSAGLRPVRQYEVVLEGRRSRLDFAWPRLRVAVEADGYRAHGGKLAHASDRQRWAALVADGWRVLPVTWADCVRQPEVFLDRVRAALLRSV